MYEPEDFTKDVDVTSPPDFNPHSSEDFNRSEDRSIPPQPESTRQESHKDELLIHPGYTWNDLKPTVRDPDCSSGTNVACFWPVYVGNFKANGPLDKQVNLYFASHGLHVRWFVQRRTDDYYMDFQSKAALYDMLVYFVSERDAKYAIQKCHRDAFNGYTMNVFPGRHPVYFDPTRSVYAERMKSGRVFSEHFFEKHVRRYNVVVDCAVKFDIKTGALEFAKPEHVDQARMKERMWIYQPVTGQMQKQRFLEKDLMKEIETFLERWPKVLEPSQDDKYMRMLLQGRKPTVNPNKNHRVVPLRRGPPKHVQIRRFQKKQEKLRKYLLRKQQKQQ